MSARRWMAVVVSVVAIGAMGQESVAARTHAPAGDSGGSVVVRPPFDSGTGEPITLRVFTNPDRTVACRRVSGDQAWLECLLVRSDEVVRFGMANGTVERVPCKAPFANHMCSLSFGRVTISPVTASGKARFAGARVVPLERLVELGRRTMPYPVCIVDPNLGLSCSTAMDDSVGEQIYIGVSDSIWSCPGYEYVDEQTAIPKGNDRCRVLRP